MSKFCSKFPNKTMQRNSFYLASTAFKNIITKYISNFENLICCDFIGMGKPGFWQEFGAQKLASPKTWIKHYHVLPLFVTCAFKIVAGTAFSIYSCFTKEFLFFRNNLELHESMPVMDPYPVKLFTVAQEYPPNPDLHETFKRMKAEEKRRVKEKGERCK